MQNNYDDSSIRSLKGAERVRERVNVMFGSNNLTGAFHTIKEIVGNALDECRAGFGDVIDVIWHKDDSISVRDYGRGVPLGWNEAEKRYNWDLVFNELYAGGKYDSDSDVYKYSIGLNGLGAASVQYTSEWFRVTSYNGGKKSVMNFKKGNPVGELQVDTADSSERGTLIQWKIDNEVFPDTKFAFKTFKEYCENQAYLSSVTFNLTDEHTGESVVFKGEGLLPYLKMKLGDKIIESFSSTEKKSGVDSKGKAYTAECEVILAITTENNKSEHLFFHNTATMRDPQGVHHQAFAFALRTFFRKIEAERGVKIVESDYKDYISVIVSSYSNITSFYNQTKDAVSDVFTFDIINTAITDILELAVAKGNETITNFIDDVVNASVARQRAKMIEQQERKARRATTMRRKPEKFKDCSERNPSKRELYIVEGDSALGSCKLARDPKFQALIPIRGKILNCLKASIDRILASDIISDLTSTIGTGVDLGKDASVFDIDKLQFDKIIICTDADVDGFQIRVLLYTMFYRLMPELLRTGHVYIAETPLFELETNKGSVFAFTVEEKNELLQSLPKQGYVIKHINRSKGLGENTPEMMRQTTMLPETRKLIPLDIDVKNEIVRELSSILFGNDNKSSRKEFVKELLGTSLSELVETVENLSDEDKQSMEENIDEN